MFSNVLPVFVFCFQIKLAVGYEMTLKISALKVSENFSSGETLKKFTLENSRRFDS